jgi:hypothetical protein
MDYMFNIILLLLNNKMLKRLLDLEKVTAVKKLDIYKGESYKSWKDFIRG